MGEWMTLCQRCPQFCDNGQTNAESKNYSGDMGFPFAKFADASDTDLHRK